MKVAIFLVMMSHAVFNVAWAQHTSFLTVGGGFSKENSPIALETNTFLFADLLSKLQFSTHSSRILFGEGKASVAEDVHYLTTDRPEGFDDYARLMNIDINATFSDYRSNHLQELLDGKSNRRTLVQNLRELAEEQPDFFRFYFTGHGNNDERLKNIFLLWGGYMDVKDFLQQLDTLPEKTHTQVVMVQCYSGGFAKMNYIGGDKEQISPANRCGFFSQTEDKPASGCSPDIHFREEYSPYFWSALRGTDEKGESVFADYDGNGVVTPEEAHAYVIIHENSIDNPITTSSDFLRDQVASPRDADFGDFDLSPTEKTIVDSMNLRFGRDFYSQSKEQIQLTRQSLKEQIEELNEPLNASTIAILNLSATFAQAMYEKYPGNFVTDEELNDFLGHESYPTLSDLYREHDALKAEKKSLKNDLVKLLRLEYLLQTKSLEGGIQTERVQSKYNQLKECEATPYFQ